MPHGGPESRDHLTFDLMVQYLAARGYAVFQPNFRGSDGFGRTFTESGYGEWGRKMQDDIGDGVELLVDRNIVDPHACASSARPTAATRRSPGATLTPELYRCVVSISGIGNLEEFLKSRRKLEGGEFGAVPVLDEADRRSGSAMRNGSRPSRPRCTSTASRRRSCSCTAMPTKSCRTPSRWR